MGRCQLRQTTRTVHLIRDDAMAGVLDPGEAEVHAAELPAFAVTVTLLLPPAEIKVMPLVPSPATVLIRTVACLMLRHLHQGSTGRVENRSTRRL